MSKCKFLVGRDMQERDYNFSQAGYSAAVKDIRVHGGMMNVWCGGPRNARGHIPPDYKGIAMMQCYRNSHNEMQCFPESRGGDDVALAGLRRRRAKKSRKR